MEDFKMPEFKKPEPAPPPPALPNIDAWALFNGVKDSNNFYLIIVCFLCLFFTTALAVFVFLRMRTTTAATDAVKEKMAVIAKYVEAIDSIRIEQEQLLKRIVRDGRWPDHVKAKWDEEDRATKRNFELQRTPLVALAGEDVAKAVKSQSGIMEQIVRASGAMPSVAANATSPSPAAAAAPAKQEEKKKGEKKNE
jgi:hypothetical protein